jgi:dTDP-4-dehydrorhamnose reductase
MVSTKFGPPRPNSHDERDAVAVVTDQVGCPTFTGHLAPALVTLAEQGPRGVVHVAGSGACSWHDFAIEIFRQAGVDCRVDAATTADMARPAPRPAFSVLGTERADAPTLPDWRRGLAAYLAERALAGASA